MPDEKDDLYSFKPTPVLTRLRRLETGAQRLQRGKIRFSDGDYKRIPANTLDVNQRIDLTQTSIKKKGSVPPSGNTSGFAYTSTDTTITWYWDGTNGSTVISLHRADGSTQVIPTAGSGLTISGLTASTTYYFLPYWPPNNLCNIGWVPGTAGSPQIAFVLADTTSVDKGSFYVLQQSLQNREPLTASYMSAATTAPAAPPGGGGGGGGGAGGACVMAGTDIQTLGEIPHTVNVHGETSWIRLSVADGRELFCTYDHPLICPERGKIEAEMLAPGDILITDAGEQELMTTDWHQRKCSKWEIVMEKGHLYWANGFLSHNVKQNKL